MIDITNQKFGKLLALNPNRDIKHHSGLFWNCVCECGTKITVRGKCLRGGGAKSCGCLQKETRSHLWRGCGDISGAYWTNVKQNAKKRGISVELSLKEAWNKFLEQNKECALSGAELQFTFNYCYNKKEQTASLDRIDSSKGYTLDNIQWVHKDVNNMKQGFSDSKFVEWCKRVANFQDDDQLPKLGVPLQSEYI